MLLGMQAQAAFAEANRQYAAERAEVDSLLQERDSAYLDLLCVPSMRGSSHARITSSETLPLGSQQHRFLRPHSKLDCGGEICCALSDHLMFLSQMSGCPMFEM